MTINRIDMEEITDRIDELRSERDDLQSALDDVQEELDAHDGPASMEAGEEARDAAQRALDEWESDNAEELQKLEALCEELRGAGGGDHRWNGDWYPRELIDVDDFEEYAEELASDICNLSDEWPHRCIDWEKAARELAQDYSMVDYDGSSYYWR